MRPPIPKEEFDLDDVTWAVHCGKGPVPLRATQAVTRFFPRDHRPWELSWQEGFVDLPGRVKESAARLLGKSPTDVSLIASTSDGLSAIASGLDLREGDEVVLPLGEFPSNIWPWRALERHGVRVREVPLWDGHLAGARAWDSVPPPPGCDPEARLAEAIGPRTRVVSASWVRFQDGLRLDVPRLAEACRARGAALVVDGIQGAGTLPVELGGASAFATNGHKGLLGPQGLGFMWTDPEFRARITPPGGWLSVEQAIDFSRPSTDVERDWATDGTRFEGGVPNLLGCAALGESLALLEEAGVEAIAAWGAELAARLTGALRDAPTWGREAERVNALAAEGRGSSIVSLHHGGRGEAWLMGLLEAGQRHKVFASVREGYLRIGLHGWHDETDLERLIAWLRD